MGSSRDFLRDVQASARHAQQRPRRYLTASVTPAWLVTPPMVIVTGTALPGVTDSGTSAFTCITPAVKPRARWVLLGRTTGRGKDDQTGRPNRSIKQVLGYPVHRRFRQLLSESDR